MSVTDETLLESSNEIEKLSAKVSKEEGKQNKGYERMSYNSQNCVPWNGSINRTVWSSQYYEDAFLRLQLPIATVTAKCKLHMIVFEAQDRLNKSGRLATEESCPARLCQQFIPKQIKRFDEAIDLLQQPLAEVEPYVGITTNQLI